MRKCDACGKPYLESKDIFCPHCGAVGQKDCNHGASYDSSRWDRGEIYSNGNNTYQQGAEPHAQRTPSAYNMPKQNKDLTGGQYGKDFGEINLNPALRNLIETVAKKANETKKDEKKVVKIIAAVFAVIAIFNVFINSVDELGSSVDIFDNSYEEDSLDYFEEVSEYPVDVIAGDVCIEPFEDWDGTWFFDLYLQKLYMYSGDDKLAIEVCDKLSGDDYVYLDGMFCTMPDKIMSIDNYYSVIDEEGCYIISDAQSTDDHTVQYWFNEGDIVYFDWVRVNFDDGSVVKLVLPFNAFSCDEEGNVTYYTCNINEEENRVVFEETNPVAVIEEFDCVVEF